MTIKKALITGITGQDGAYLAQLLLKKGYKVYGTFRRVSTPNFWRLQSLDIYSKCHMIPADLLDMGSMIKAIKISDPDEVYNLAASSFVSTAFEQPVGNGEITALAVTKLLETIRFIKPSAKFYQASSSEMYGNSNIRLQDEETPFIPASPYAIAKLYAHWITNIYKDAYNMFTCTGILFNHESPLRGMEFVSRKITNGVAKIVLGLEKEIFLGNLDSKRDWGYAPEYMEAVHTMLQQDKPDTFVISTGEAHSVREFASLAFDLVGLDWKKYVKVDKSLFRPIDVRYLCGSYKKAKKEIGWKPKITFFDLVKIMIDEDMRRWKTFLDGKSLPWDAPLYPSESNTLLSNQKRHKFEVTKAKRKTTREDHNER